MDSTAPERATHELVFIRVGTEGYAIPSDVVREIVGHYTLEALPGAPAPFVGLLAHRGQLLPVVDAATLLDQPSGRGHAEQVLVLGRHAPEIALLVSRVEAIRRVPDTELRRPPGSGEEHRLVRRLTTDAVAVIDGLRLLDDPRIAPGHTEGNGASKHPDANSRGEGSCE
jgi:chemotaxis signal transduction protein